MRHDVSIIDPRATTEWDTFVESHPGATVFHTSAWARVVLDTYNYRPMYYVSRDGDLRIRAAVPLMRVEGRLTSRRFVGLPFSDVCAPLLDGDSDSGGLLSELRLAALEAGASHVEVRGGESMLEEAGFRGGTAFYQHIVPINGNAEETAKGFHSSARRAIRKSEKEGLSVRHANDLADMREFYRLTVLTRKKHGLLPQPWRFFENIHRHMIAAGAGHLLLAEYEGRPVAGDLLLRFRDQMVYKFNASDPEFLHLRPNNLLLWEAIKLSAELGCRTLDLGRCDEDNDGLRRFKLLWGSEERVLRYYSYKSGAANGNPATSLVKEKLLPLFVKVAPGYALRGMGAAVYHNFG